MYMTAGACIVAIALLMAATPPSVAGQSVGPLRVDLPGDTLPVLDDFGNPITQAEIEARMRSGRGAGFLGGLIGGLGGLFLGGAIAFGECGILEYCSPREEARGSVAIFAGFAWGVTLGAVGGSNLRGVDRWEALARIREERRAAAAP